MNGEHVLLIPLLHSAHIILLDVSDELRWTRRDKIPNVYNIYTTRGTQTPFYIKNLNVINDHIFDFL